jgi:membrane-associated phospholipid phosphatase|tara:strand:+ start:917 stop:1648 length:732 start_codon:yes stop_codon:yes gene_type:complete
MKHQSLIILLIIAYSGLFAQSPYNFSFAVDIPVITVGAATALGGFIHERKRDALQLEDIMDLNRMDVGKFDRGATFNWNPKAAHWSDALLYANMGTPLLFLAGERSRKDFGTIAAISAEVFLLNTGITYLTKELVQRKRPYVYHSDAPLEKKLDKGSSQSFFSGHTSSVASMSFSFAMMHQHYYPNSKLKPLVWILAGVLPMATAVLRVRGGKHFWTDVLIGYGAGASIGVGVPLLHRINFKK